MSRSWRILDSWQLFRNRFISMRVDRCELPDGRVMPDYYVLEFSDWVQVIPLTADNQVVMVKQYRHGIQEVLWEIPGGSTHPGQVEDTPLIAAQRELREETGYSAKKWTHLGTHAPNPALQSNRMHIFLAEDCVKVGEPQLDPFEDLEVVLIPLKQLYDMAERGQMSHALVLAGLLMARGALKERL